ncbi:MAG: hypothetical protein ACTSU5_00120 [Promethearchaeota archaeon]
MADALVYRNLIPLPRNSEGYGVVGGDRSQECAPSSSGWDVSGFHRILGGYLYQQVFAVLSIVLGILLFGYFVPQYVLPYPEVLGYYNIVQGLLLWSFVLSDLGLSQALTKFVSAHWQHDPQKALHYVQVYMRVKLFLSTAFLSAITALVLLVFPYTDFAYLAMFVLVYAVFPVPSTFNVGYLLLNAIQHHDFAEKVRFLRDVVFKFGTIVSFSLAGLLLGRSVPVVGELAGLTAGYLVGTYAYHLFAFAWAAKYIGRVFRDAGGQLELRDMFRGDYSREELKEMLKFGIHTAFSDLVSKGALALATFTWILVVPAYNSWLGLATIALVVGNLVSIPVVIATNSAPAISEALQNDDTATAEYYVRQSLKYLFLFSFMNFLQMVVVVPPLAGVVFDLVGPQYAGVLLLLPFTAVFKLVEPISILADQILLGANKPRKYLHGILVQRAVDVAVVVSFPFLFRVLGVAPQFLLAVWFFPGLVATLFVKWHWIKHRVFPGGASKKGAIAVPLLAGSSAVAVVAPTFFLADALSSHFGWVALFVVYIPLGAVVFSDLYYIFVGFFGGMDDHDINLLKSTIDIVGPSKRNVRTMIRYIEFGRRLSPFKNSKFFQYNYSTRRVFKRAIQKMIAREDGFPACYDSG